MTKEDMITAVRRELDCSRETAACVVDALFAEIAARLAAGDRITLPGLGVLIPGLTRGGIGRNPATGESLMLTPKPTAKFKMKPVLQRTLAAAMAPEQEAPDRGVVGHGQSGLRSGRRRCAVMPSLPSCLNSVTRPG